MDNLQKRTEDCISFEEQAEYCHNVAVFNRGKNLRFHIQTLGCQMNEADSEQISGMLIQMGYTFIEDIEKADLIIINTCCVRENAEFKLYGHIGELKILKKTNKNLITIVCGCMMQQKHVVEKIKNSYKYIDIVFGTHNRHELPKMLLSRLSTGKKVYEIWEDNKGIAENVPVERKNNISAFVPITYGCDNFCSYCIVPYVRGRETSRDPEKIKQDIIDLSQKGIKEITLLGQNVNSYNYGMDFSKLLYYSSDVPGIERIRFMTSHPKDLSDNLIKAMAEIPSICNHIHLPLQSGSTEVLKQMNRKYTKDDYISLVSKIKMAIPEISISTDIIVGFPGETEYDFNETLDVYKKTGFDFAYTFIYSKRTGTPAAKRIDQIDDDVKGKRFKRLVDLVNEMTLSSNVKDENKILKVLVEGKSRTDDKIMTGRTESNKIVNFRCDSDFTGKIVNVKIIKGHTWHLEGEKI
ncbi:MAG: tRNA (N6-isopentenyl adenosine(37)-C2)-methylthiotransferase MiaB [Clostridiaceae bacterium]|nr:tRNA (N6-isopentenyl adenosine(37)-C2)-methylthiotransferase MiaB [Clostridiaceae bacterium]